MKPFAIHQFHPVIEEFSAVSNEVLALREIFRDLGYRSEVFSAEPCSIPESGVQDWRGYRADSRDLLLIHYSLGSPVFESAFAAPGRKALVYHGVTPSRLLASLPSVRRWAEAGEGDLAKFAHKTEAAIAHSDFCAGDLHRTGYKNVEVLPYTMWERLYESPPVNHRRDGDSKSLLVVGRIMPHKCVEDSILVLDYLRNHIGADWRLILVGSSNGAETYRERIVSLAGKMNLRDVVWAGPVSQTALIGYYKLADAFLLTSEHEGFGVPLVEAMRYDVPIFACANAAVPQVLGDAGVLFEGKNRALIAETIHLVTQDPQRREAVLLSQRARRECFSHASAEQRWRKWIELFQGFK